MKLPKWEIAVGFASVLLVAIIISSHSKDVVTPRPDGDTSDAGEAVQQCGGRTFIEFDIHQSMDLIKITSFSEPPQFAIWLEDPESHKLKTIFVAYRSGTGDLVGKAECPGCLPLWFAVYERERGKMGMPTPDNPAPDAVTVATPFTESFQLRYEIERGSKWICWMEMNLAGDFNERYQEYNEQDETIDWDFSGQPPLVYRCEIEGIPGKKIVPELYGIVNMDKPFEQMIEPLNEDITTAREVFKSIEIRIVRAKANESK